MKRNLIVMLLGAKREHLVVDLDKKDKKKSIDIKINNITLPPIEWETIEELVGSDKYGYCYGDVHIEFDGMEHMFNTIDCVFSLLETEKDPTETDIELRLLSLEEECIMQEQQLFREYVSNLQTHFHYPISYREDIGCEDDINYIN